MNKILTIACLALILSACNSANNTATKGANDSTESTTTTPAKAVDVTLNMSQQKELDTFFSNFAEMSLESFTQKAGISNEELIRFSVMHNYINRAHCFVKVDDYNVKIKKEHLEESAKKYFGKSIQSHKSIEGVAYSNGYYTMPRADGEAFSFAQIDKLSDIGDHRFEALVNVYTAGSGWTGNTHDNPANYAKDPEGGPQLSYKVKALILKDSNGKYQLLEYLKR